MRLLQRYLEQFPVTRGPLDLSRLLSCSQPVLDSSNDEELIVNPREQTESSSLKNSCVSKSSKSVTFISLQERQVLSTDRFCEFISRYVDCEVLIMSKWNERIDDILLRCIGMTMGGSLLDIDLSHSIISHSEVLILFPRLFCLKSIRLSNCPFIDNTSCRIITQTCYKTLTLFYINDCPLIKHDAYLYMTGSVGLDAPRITKLTMLDISNCRHMEDRSLLVLSKCTSRLRHLNMSGNTSLTDIGVCAVLQASPRLVLLSLAGCWRITSQVLTTLARHCSGLLSLNVSLCSAITDVGVCTLASGCQHIQAINLAGIRNLSEIGLCRLAENCPGLLMLNVTGCDKIALSGIRALVSGLKYVSEGVTFVGFKPQDSHIEQKLMNQLQMIHEEVVVRIQKAIKTSKTKKETIRQYKNDQLNGAARILQRNIRAYGRRQIFLKMHQRRIFWKCAQFIQSVYRGSKGRTKARQQAAILAEYRILYPTARCIQRYVRGHIARLRYSHVYTLVNLMYKRRYIESRMAIIVIIQRQVRRMIVHKRIASFSEIINRNRSNKVHAATLIQQLARSKKARNLVAFLRKQKRDYEYVLDTASRRIQKWIKDCMMKIKAKRDRLARELLLIKMTQSANLAQRVFRGYVGRQELQRRQIVQATRWFAATLIQKCFRRSLVLHWRDIRLNTIASFVFDRYTFERSQRRIDCVRRYTEYIKANAVDSASEDDDDPYDTCAATDWIECAQSKSGAKYWFNSFTKEKTFIEPTSSRDIDLSYIGLRVRILWILQDDWFTGVISKFNGRKRKYRVEYDDGDHEWIDLERDSSRIQIYIENDDSYTNAGDGGIWVMKQLYMSEEQKREAEKRQQRHQEKNSKELAFRDAKQWVVIKDEVNAGKTLFMSDISGELRAGSPDALDWDIRADDMGYPMFYNTQTEAVSYEDPRFTYDISADLSTQRDFVMQELRFTIYFCEDLLQQYSQAVNDNNAASKTKALKNIRNSDKPKQLSALVLRAKALFSQSSVVDKGVDIKVRVELENAFRLCEIISSVVTEANFSGIVEAQKRSEKIQEIKRKFDRPLQCVNCKHEVKRHHEYCPTCGKKLML